MGCGACRNNVTVRIDKKTIPKTPSMDVEGAIVYPEGESLPVIQGYQVDPENTQRLLPLIDADCEKRITGIMMTKDGSFEPHHVCRNSDSEHKSQRVTLRDCSTCPVRCPVKK